MISIVIEMQTTSGKKLQSKLTYLNDQATDLQLYNLATALVNLTTNTFVNVQKTTQEQLNPSLARSGKSTTPVTLDTSEGIAQYSDGNETTATQILLAAENDQAYFKLITPHSDIYETDFNARVYSETGDKHYNLAIETNGHEHVIQIRPRNEIDAASNGDATITAFFPESASYAATSYDFFIKGE